MKHKRKCIEKKSYNHLSKVYNVILNNWIQNRDAIGWYECPVCLDFHVTKKQDNRNQKLKERCRKAYLRNHFPKREPVHVLLEKRKRQMVQSLIGIRFRDLLPYKIKPQTLSLSEQREAIARLSTGQHLSDQ